MQILLLASEYVQDERPRDGIFIKDQALALSRNGTKVNIAFVEYKSLRSISLKSLLTNHFQIVSNDENGILTLRQKGWNPCLNSFYGGIIWAYLTKKVVDIYITKHGLPDIIHAHNIFWAGYAALLVSGKYKIPYVITEHSSRLNKGLIPVQMGRYAQKVLLGANQIIAVSNALASAIKRYSGSREIRIIPNVVDTDFFTQSARMSQSDLFTFFAVGNMLFNKGFDVLIRAFAEKFSINSPVRLVLGGEGPQLKTFKALSKDLGIANITSFKGAMTRNQVREALWDSQVLVLPSLSETFGVVLIEALSAGVPVIASKCGGPEDIVTPEVGYLFEPGNIIELSEIMDMIVHKYEFNKDTLRHYAVNKYSEKSISESLLKIYYGVLGIASETNKSLNS